MFSDIITATAEIRHFQQSTNVNELLTTKDPTNNATLLVPDTEYNSLLFKLNKKLHFIFLFNSQKRRFLNKLTQWSEFIQIKKVIDLKAMFDTFLHFVILTLHKHSF